MRVFILLVILTFSFLISCNDKPDTRKAELQEIYTLAAEVEDFHEMAHVRYQQFALEPNQLHYLDSILELYVRSGNYNSGHKLADYLLDITKTDFRLLRAGVANLQIGDADAAKIHLTELLERTPTFVEAQYFLGSAELQLNNPAEAMEHLTAVLADSSAVRSRILVPTDGAPQKVVLFAAALNVIGFLEWQAGNQEMAVTAWREALKADPGFRSPANNLNAIEGR